MFSQFTVPVVGVICRILQNVMESEISAKLQIPKGCTLQGQESVKAGNKKRYSRRVGIYKNSSNLRLHDSSSDCLQLTGSQLFDRL